MGILETVASFFVRTQRRETERKYLPGQYSDRRADKEIRKEHRSQVTGEVIGWTLKSGHYIVAKDAMDRHSEAIIGMMP